MIVCRGVVVLSYINVVFSGFCFCFVFLIVCFTSYFVFCIAILPHIPGVVYYHLLLRRETRVPGVAPFLECTGDRNPIHPQPLGSCGPLQE